MVPEFDAHDERFRILEAWAGETDINDDDHGS